MSTLIEDTSTPFDEPLSRVEGLTWLPWVGRNWADLPDGQRVLVVAESHYSSERDPDLVVEKVAETSAMRTYTRAVVAEALIRQEWSTRTLINLHNLLYAPPDRNAFWGNLSYHNIVQRPMSYQDGSLVRPSWQDFREGWKVLLKMLPVLQPDHILFIGVSAAGQFGPCMQDQQVEHTPVAFPEKIGNAYARTAQIGLGGRSYPLHFIRHCGSYFSTDLWRDYLLRSAPELMASVARSAGTTAPRPSPRKLHVLGMAKSCLDCRGAKEQKIELDFLRLAYAVRDLREAGEEAIGYLVVLDETVAAKATGWIDRYHTGDAVCVLCIAPTEEERHRLEAEKVSNAQGMLPSSEINTGSSLSRADLGKAIGETALATAIESKHPGIVHSSEKQPLGIRWDFYGTVDAPES